MKDVQTLDLFRFHLMSILDIAVTVQNGSKSSLVVKFKEKKENDPILLELKGAVNN